MTRTYALPASSARSMRACDQPDEVINQIEGDIVDRSAGRSRNRYLRRPPRNHADVEDYPILRFAEVPEVEIELIDRPDCPPLGVGEAAKFPLPPRSQMRSRERSTSASPTYLSRANESSRLAPGLRKAASSSRSDQPPLRTVVAAFNLSL